MSSAARLPVAIMAQRFSAQLLTGDRPTTPEAVAERITAVQAQDARGSLLAVRARSRGLTATDVDQRLTSDRSLVVDWLNRGTLHLVRAEDHAWLHALTSPRLVSANARRLAQEGVTADAAERGVSVITHELTRYGPRTRAELRAALDSAGVRTVGQAFIHTLGLASIRGVCLRGPVIDGERAFVLTSDWLGPRPVVDRNAALGELARRYLLGHGPASDRDLAYWSGLALRDVRAGLQTARAKLLDGSPELLTLNGKPITSYGTPAPTLLGMFDPLLHGWPARASVLGEHDSTHVVTSNGMFRATALVDGRATATWTLRAGQVEITALPGETIDSQTSTALSSEASDVLRYLGVEADAL